METTSKHSSVRPLTLAIALVVFIGGVSLNLPTPDALTALMLWGLALVPFVICLILGTKWLQSGRSQPHALIAVMAAVLIGILPHLIVLLGIWIFNRAAG